MKTPDLQRPNPVHPEASPGPSSTTRPRLQGGGLDTRAGGPAGYIDARTEHLIALVRDGARLEDAARPYGLSAERVRQILREGGVTARDLPGRAERGRDRRFAPACELAPVIEAMWREGMLCHEIAMLFDVSGEAVHRLICERVPARDRVAQAARRVEDERSQEERLLQGVRKAAIALTETRGIDPAHRRRAQARVEGWLAAHSQLSPAPVPTPPPTADSAATSASEPLTTAELRGELERFRAALRAAGLRGSTITAYLHGSSLFVRWLAGEYVPRAKVT
jgi:transposase